MDEKRYNDVLVACALVKDLKLLPNGDLTEIGEQVIHFLYSLYSPSSSIITILTSFISSFSPLHNLIGN
jgi:hypothetical protein